MRRGGVGEEREGRALVGPVGDAQNVIDDGDGAAHGDVGGDPGLGEPVGGDDQRGDEQEQPGQGGGAEARFLGQVTVRPPRWRRIDAHFFQAPIGSGVQTFCQMP